MVDDARGSEHLEPPGVATRPVVITALSTLGVVVTAIFMLASIYAWQVPSRKLPVPQTFPEPRVETHQAEDRQRIEAQQRRRLTQYRWVDQNKTLVQIPIERAMKIIAARGQDAYGPILPSPAAVSSPTAGAQRATTPAPGSSGSAASAPQPAPESKP